MNRTTNIECAALEKIITCALPPESYESTGDITIDMMKLEIAMAHLKAVVASGGLYVEINHPHAVIEENAVHNAHAVHNSGQEDLQVEHVLVELRRRQKAAAAKKSKMIGNL